MKVTFAPSAYDQWMNCTASAVAVFKERISGVLPKQEEKGESAEEGIVAHEVLELSMTLMISPRDFIGQTLQVEQLSKSVTVDAEMGEELDKAYDYIKDFITPGSKVWVEQQVSLDKFLPDSKGKADVVILSADGKTLHVFDLKYGRGIVVHAMKNGQMQLYGLGVIDCVLDMNQRILLEDVVLHVVQPRIGNIDSWKTTKHDLERFRLRVRDKFMIASDPEKRSFSPGSHCFFCERKAVCKPLADSIYSTVFEDNEPTGFDDIKNPDTLTTEELAKMYPMLDFISSWVYNIKRFMEAQALRGTEYPGLKVVEGKKGTRSWKNEEEATKYLLEKGFDDEKLYKKTIISPAQAENLIGRKKLDSEFKELFTQPGGKPNLVTEDDPRPTLAEALANEFDD